MYLVCDGGGTKTDFLLFEKTGCVRGRAQGAGANANFVPPAEAAHTVYAGVMECLAQAGAAPAQVREFVLFIPGFRPALPELETLLGSGNVRQLGDEKNAFYAALGAPCGIAVLSGTGSFATGRDKAGRTATAGGWGPLFSDEGSGYHIGVLCLSRLALLHDTHVTGTLLEKNVLEMLGLPDVLSIRDAAYRPDFTRRHVARLSYAVERSAREGDANACAVLDEAACALARLAATVAGQLDADGLPVALTGGDPKGRGEQTAAEDEKVLAFQSLELHVPANPLIDFQVHDPKFYKKKERRIVAATIRKMQAPNHDAAVFDVSGSPLLNFPYTFTPPINPTTAPMA